MQKKTTKKNTVTKKNISDSLKMVEDILTDTSNGFFISVKKSENKKKPLHLLTKITNVNREFVLLSVLKALDMDADDLTMFCISQAIK